MQSCMLDSNKLGLKSDLDKDIELSLSAPIQSMLLFDTSRYENQINPAVKVSVHFAEYASGTKESNKYVLLQTTITWIYRRVSSGEHWQALT